MTLTSPGMGIIPCRVIFCYEQAASSNDTDIISSALFVIQRREIMK